jgi:putative ABC transport system substrate-binding protein
MIISFGFRRSLRFSNPRRLRFNSQPLLDQIIALGLKRSLWLRHQSEGRKADWHDDSAKGTGENGKGDSMKVVGSQWSVVSKNVFSFALCALLLALCLPVEAQQLKKVPRIGFLTLLAKPDPHEKAFLLGLRDLGYIDGQSITIEYRRATGEVDRLPALAEELVRLKVDLIVVHSTPVVQAAKNATTTIPIVMLGAADPVGSGFVASLARPGGNITGNSNIQPELAGKRFELLRDIVPKLSRVAFLAHGGDPAHKLFVKEAQEAAERLKIQIRPAVIDKVEEIEAAFSTMNRERAEALIVQPLFIRALGQGQKIADLAVRNHLLTVSDGTGFAEVGGLLFYGPDLTARYRRGATFVDKILKGAKPADIPVEQPTKFELVINLKTAKQIGLTIPPNVLARADRVIR